MSYINVNNIYSFTNPFSSSNAGAITIPLSPIQHGPGCTAVGSGSHAEGRVTTASGDESHAEGYNTTSSGNKSHSEGYDTVSFGLYSHAEGEGTAANGQSSHAEGKNTIASGTSSHAEGNLTKAIGNYSHSEGVQTISNGVYSHAEGIQTTANGLASHAEGQFTEANGDKSHAEGRITKAYGLASHTEGYVTTANGDYSHAEGSSTTASGTSSHAEGNLTTAIGTASHAEGEGTTATGNYSHAEGLQTESIGMYSHAEGFGTVANALYQHVTGVYNIIDTQVSEGAFIIGNGSLLPPHTRSNLLFAYENQVEIFGNTKTETIQITSGATAGYVLTSDALGNGTWQSVAGASDTYVISSTLNGTDLEINRNNGQPQIVVDLSPLSGVDTFVTGSTLSGTTLLIDRNQGEPQISVDLSSLADDTIVNGFTYSNNNLTITQNGQSDLTTNISVMTGVTVNGPADFTDEVLINSTTLFGTTTWNPSGVSRASHRINGTNTPTLSDGTDGQLLHIYVADILSAGSSTVTVTSSLGFNTIAFNAVGDTVTLMFNQGFGWSIVGSHNVTIS